MTAPGGAAWWIGLDAWVLQDGNYTDFVTGERRQFALELGYDRSQRLVRVEPTTIACDHTGRRSWYTATGPLLRAAATPRSDAFVLDVGIRAYDQWLVLDDLEPPVVGTWLSGEVALSVDPFMYMDELAGLLGMPPLIYTWSIDEIQVDESPLVRVEHGHPWYAGPDEGPYLVVDRSRERWRTVERTDTAQDRSYRLRCTLVDSGPVSTMAASGSRSPYGPLG